MKVLWIPQNFPSSSSHILPRECGSGSPFSLVLLVLFPPKMASGSRGKTSHLQNRVSSTLVSGEVFLTSWFLDINFYPPMKCCGVTQLLWSLYSLTPTPIICLMSQHPLLNYVTSPIRLLVVLSHSEPPRPEIKTLLIHSPLSTCLSLGL